MSSFVRAGGWLFRRRTSIPLPLALALLLLPPNDTFLAGRVLIALGTVGVVAAESLRLWAVHHIGVISRTRSDRLGPLVSTGPFAIVRNPLYLGNIGLWVGFALSARILWLVPVFLIVLSLEYHAIVRWEEALLESRRGSEYRLYAARVPRWMPTAHRSLVGQAPAASSWRETLFSERGTLIAIAIGYLLLWAKSYV